MKDQSIPSQEIWLPCRLHAFIPSSGGCYSVLPSFTGKLHLTWGFSSFTHSFQLSSKLNLLLGVLIQTLDLSSKVLGKVSPLCFQGWCQESIFNGKWLWM